MVRDPVCGTYVIPDRAIALADGSGQRVLLFARAAATNIAPDRMTLESALRADIVEVGRRMYAREYTDRTPAISASAWATTGS